MSSFVDIAFKKFDMITPIRRVPSEGRVKWLCKCDCGNELIASGENIRGGNTGSCACRRGESRRRHGMANRTNNEYTIWTGMMQRCTNPKTTNYANYGGRGISVCEEWRSFDIFYRDMGTRPSLAHSLERRNNEAGYNKSNCYWATAKQQSRNMRRNVIIEFGGRSMCVAEAAERACLPYSAVYQRLFVYGWDVRRALTAPIQMQRRSK